MNIQAIEDRLVSTCLELRPRHRLAFDGYYDRLLNSGKILTDADRAIVPYVAETLPDRYLCEFCAGIGQLSYALSHSGLPIVSVESNVERFNVLLEIAAESTRWWADNTEWQRTRFRADNKVWIITNGVSAGNQRGDLDIFRCHLDCAGHLIWQPSLFGVENPEAMPLEGYNSVDLGHGVYHQWK